MLWQNYSIPIMQKKQRPLASFVSYFLFNDIINDYWSQDLENDTRLFLLSALPLVADYGDYSIASKGIYPNSEKLLRREKKTEAILPYVGTN